MTYMISFGHRNIKEINSQARSRVGVRRSEALHGRILTSGPSAQADIETLTSALRGSEVDLAVDEHDAAEVVVLVDTVRGEGGRVGSELGDVRVAGCPDGLADDEERVPERGDVRPIGVAETVVEARTVQDGGLDDAVGEPATVVEVDALDTV